MITDRRNHLGTDVVEASECLKSWSKNNLITADISDRAMRAIGELDEYHSKSIGTDNEDTGDELD